MHTGVPLMHVDSRFRGNDGKRRLERAYCLDVPAVTARTGPPALAGFRGNDGTGAGDASPAKARIRSLLWRTLVSRLRMY